MRQTLNEWLWFVVAGCLFLWPSFSFAGSAKPPPCEMYKAIAEDVMMFRDKGYSLEYVDSMINQNQEQHVIDNMKSIIEQGYVWPRGREDFKDWIYQMCKAKGWQSQAYIEMHPVASSQKLYCENIATVAESMERDFQFRDIRPEHFKNEGQAKLAMEVEHCVNNREQVRACVMRRCLGSNL